MLHGDAHAGEVSGEGYRRPAVALGVLKGVRVDDKTPPSGERDVAVFPHRLGVEQRLATLSSPLDRQAAPVAAIHLPDLHHGITIRPSSLNGKSVL